MAIILETDNCQIVSILIVVSNMMIHTLTTKIEILINNGVLPTSDHLLTGRIISIVPLTIEARMYDYWEIKMLVVSMFMAQSLMKNSKWIKI